MKPKIFLSLIVLATLLGACSKGGGGGGGQSYPVPQTPTTGGSNSGGSSGAGSGSGSSGSGSGTGGTGSTPITGGGGTGTVPITGGGGTTTPPITDPGTGGTVVVIPEVNRVDTFVNLLNEHYVEHDFYIVKEPHQTMTEGFLVVYDANAGYIAYDLAAFVPGESWESYKTRAEYQEVFIHKLESDQFANTFYFGDAYTNGETPMFMGEFVFDETSETSKDLETAKSIRESFKLSSIASAVSAEFGLSQERGEEIAKLAMSWKKLSKTRSLSSADADMFSKELLGVDVTTATAAITKHLNGVDKKDFKEIIEKAAERNDTTPENMSAIVQAIFQ